MNPYINDSDFQLYVGDVREVLAELPAESVHCVVTSPPYWGLRDYGTGAWAGGDPECVHRVGGQVQDTKAPGASTTGQRPGVDASRCLACGATRTDLQLGLEPTPEEYVANMVDVFRGVRRVLRDDGTVWLNLGDSYSGQAGGAQGSTGSNATRTAGKLNIRRGLGGNVPAGLKPKDLCMIPARVAMALQEPYYTGRIKDVNERFWLAAMVDGEGCIYIHKRKAGQSNGQGYERKNDSYGSGMEISNTSREVIERVAAITGRGSISEVKKGADERRRQTLYRWNLRTNECRDVLRELYPYLVAKQQQARLAINCPSSGPQAAAAHTALKALHRGEPTTVDVPAPESMYEPGWYLRSDIVWFKNNPMPESVTDRPTKAHEYVFLLTKQPRYFFDADAVREPAEWSFWGKQTTRKTSDDALVKPPTYRENGRDELRAAGAGRNLRSVWEIATEPYPDAHFATFPQALVEPCVKAGSSEKGCCPECGAPWVRVVERDHSPYTEAVSGSIYEAPGKKHRDSPKKVDPANRHFQGYYQPETATIGWNPSCECGRGEVGNRATRSRNNAVEREAASPCTVLDPFLGSGTTALVARKHGRRSIGIELSPEYAKLAANRLSQLSLLAEPDTSGPVPQRSRGLTGGAYNPPGQSPHSNARERKPA